MGESSLITQGNCGPFTHAGAIRAYDFALAIGRTISAVRDGLVTGFTGGNPHLHFQVLACAEGCDTVRVTFRNARPFAPDGLQMGVTYTALPP